ncbi:hypothetical protein BKA93DRAFT_445860 [Sparassis latifolia]|uniref:AAA+ ATPase domain-containing protein n=1 Tax=Sparassis crispa TaxID=139825 RepID=A0A401GHZ1_9APHY|nr:hypothetical protein SCP_0401650 [Sparassis crispa]GBE81792.1 hypothetical protein SCP_0401650 [Sparassis crispa]
MTEIDSSLFGQPSNLLAANVASKLSSSTEISQEEPMLNGHLSTKPFVLGGLLGVASHQTTVSVPGSSDAEPADDQSSTLFASERHLQEDHFTPNGLLAEQTSTLGGLLSGERPIAVASGAVETVADAPTLNESFIPTGLLSSTSQSQDEEFPDVSDLLRPYVNANAAGSSSASTTLCASTFEGKVIFLKRKPRRGEKSSSTTSSAASSAQKFGKLLDVPIHRLLDDLSVTVAAKLSYQEANPAPAVPSRPSTSTDASLLTDRYRPKRFTELLGDDRVHREVMAWVKEWDHCVFGGRKGRGRKRPREEDSADEWRRPKEKLLLLSGPPGLGKTTLAHIVAQHAGYSVFEINASDARTAQVVDDRIRPALESGSAVGSSKPILVVVDEIDGATGGTDNSSGFIQRLIQLTYDKPRKKGRKLDPKASRPLLRPIICICNDLYASSLAKLRPLARIVRFSRPNDVHLVRRLRDICETEGLRAESRALTTLVGVSQGDLRGCLNMLQFIKARGKEVTEPTVRAATIGMKGGNTSPSSVLNDLFAPMSRKRAKDLGIGEEEEARYVGRLSREVEDSGSVDKIALGCFEHYANLHQHDGNFSRYLKGNEWLGTFDIMSGEMWSEREYALLQYLPYTLVPFYPLFQERGGPRVERPKADWENYVQTKMNEEIYKSLGRSLRAAAGFRHCGGFRHLASDQILQLELAPLLNRIISPPLHPVNSQVIRPHERAILSRLIDIMVALELRFVQENAEDGQLVYRLDPPIDVFVTYDGKRATDISVSRYALRHLVAAEIDAQLASRQVDTIENKRSKADFFSRRKRKASENEEEVEAEGDGQLVGRGSNVVVNKRARKDDAEPAEKVATDFFGRPIIPKTSNETQKSSAPVVKYQVKYRFKEGNSSAVRKPVKVGAFL